MHDMTLSTYSNGNHLNMFYWSGTVNNWPMPADMGWYEWSCLIVNYLINSFWVSRIASTTRMCWWPLTTFTSPWVSFLIDNLVSYCFVAPNFQVWPSIIRRLSSAQGKRFCLHRCLTKFLVSRIALALMSLIRPWSKTSLLRGVRCMWKLWQVPGLDVRCLIIHTDGANGTNDW